MSPWTRYIRRIFAHDEKNGKLLDGGGNGSCKNTSTRHFEIRDGRLSCQDVVSMSWIIARQFRECKLLSFRSVCARLTFSFVLSRESVSPRDVVAELIKWDLTRDLTPSKNYIEIRLSLSFYLDEILIITHPHGENFVINIVLWNVIKINISTFCLSLSCDCSTVWYLYILLFV